MRLEDGPRSPRRTESKEDIIKVLLLITPPLPRD